MSATASLEHTLSQIPDAPGVYQMIGRSGEILYIGKAVSLRSRVRSYFQDSAAHHIRTQAMVERVVDVRTIVVSNEIEALILEANLIKRYQPPFNVRLARRQTLSLSQGDERTVSARGLHPLREG